MGEFRMPSLGADMEQGQLIEWLVKVGDPVRRGDIIAVVETPKSTVEVECFETGTIRELVVEEGQTVPVGAVLAHLGEPSQGEEGQTVPEAPAAASRAAAAKAAAPEPAAKAAPARVPVAAAEPATVATPSPMPPRRLSPVLRHLARELGVDPTTLRGTGPDGTLTRHDLEQAAVAHAHRARVSPLARRLAAEAGVDLARVVGTGPGGSVRAEDVRRAAAAAESRPELPESAAVSANGNRGAAAVQPPLESAAGFSAEPEERPAVPTRTDEERASDMRRSIAALMTVSNREIPHYHLSLTVDLNRGVEWVRERNRDLDMGERLVPSALLIAAAARAARAVPQLNGHWVEGDFRPAADVDLGLILSLRTGGLLVPVIPHADRLPLRETMAAIRELTRRARAGRLRGSDLATPSITVTNLGDQGVESVHGVIYPPQVALVGFGAVVTRPWAVDGMLGVRPLVTVTLAGDHRATDGATGARFLKTIDRLLQTPEEMCVP